MISKFLVSLPP